MVKRETGHKKGAIVALLCAFGFLLCALLSFPLPPREVPAQGETYEVFWADGGRETLNYARAYSLLCGAEKDRILLGREGFTGEIEAGARFSECFTALREGSLLSLLTEDFGGLSRIERAALYRQFGNTGYYSADLFAYNGDRVFRTTRTRFSELVLLDGDLPSSVIAVAGATELILRGEAQLSASALCGTEISLIEAAAPYSVKEGALYLATAGGTRLVAALPALEELTVAECDFCDEGALSPCTSLRFLALPFAGSGAGGKGSDFDGRLSHLFGGALPETLKRVKISGGTVLSYAFAGCAGVEELDLCGIPAEEVSEAAFAPLTELKSLHTARKMTLADFERSELPCGCFLYRRRETR